MTGDEWKARNAERRLRADSCPHCGRSVDTIVREAVVAQEAIEHLNLDEEVMEPSDVWDWIWQEHGLDIEELQEIASDQELERLRAKGEKEDQERKARAKELWEARAARRRKTS